MIRYAYKGRCHKKDLKLKEAKIFAVVARRLLFFSIMGVEVLLAFV